MTTNRQTYVICSFAQFPIVKCHQKVIFCKCVQIELSLLLINIFLTALKLLLRPKCRRKVRKINLQVYLE